MLFKVKNLGLIDEAAIKLDGITVITGKNNVGKSTIGLDKNEFQKQFVNQWENGDVI